MITIRESLFDIRGFKISQPVLLAIAERYHARYESKNKVLDDFDDRVVRWIHEAFIEIKPDMSGRYLEWRLSEHMCKCAKRIRSIEFDKELLGSSGVKHQIDVVGLDEKGNVRAVGEAKEREKINKDAIYKWKEVVADLLRSKENRKSLWHSFFLTTGYYTDDAIMSARNELNENGELYIEAKGFLHWSSKFFTRFHFLEERQGKPFRIFPKHWYGYE